MGVTAVSGEQYDNRRHFYDTQYVFQVVYGFVTNYQQNSSVALFFVNV